ncbi:putative mediator of RNA polymerase II transcription subunit 26 isoform X2 [Contarinia nasturtii]|uniref:putative mediator of RNA polymerase II transcription subunit 26 isoform X2 n=1 Tax=Contarinia nasturtii TaxID=265458 RepID=UPI0012D3FD1E|nr:putative mediator of RNA polymerase II transcription subunit 26 isoform X2 [Contarinia nasturtii]
MSSVKRSSLASSELGQLKSPDKWETTSSKTSNASATNTNDTTCDTMSSSTATKTQQQQQSRDAPKAGNSTQQVTKNLDLDDYELKNLLDEAYSYKGPKDKENKSEIFKELLHKVEIEDQQKNTFFTTRQFRGNSRRHHTGGSLQDLVDSANNEQLLDSDYMLGPQSRRHQQNSRYTKNLSSVSSRQREGGSLPNNVNSSSTYSLSTFPLSKYSKGNAKNCAKNKLESHDYERHPLSNHHRPAFIGESVSYCEESQPSIASTSASVINANDKNHTIINIDDPEETRHLLAHDSLAQDTSEVHREDGTELLQLKKHRQATMNYLSNVKDLGEASRQNCSVDTPIHFLKYSSPTISEASLSGKVYTKSSIDPKYAPTRHVPLNPPQVNTNKLDENGNAILAKPTTTIPLLANPPTQKLKPKRSNKADRNTTTWTVPTGIDYNIDSIVAFIENTDTTKKTNNNLSATERTNRKEKKNIDNKKKEVNRLKKSTSMEELKSSSKIEEEIAQSERAQVSLRQKQMQNAQKRNTTTSTDNSKQSNNKRGERRSWGTEELHDFETSDERETKKHKETKPNTKNNRKTEHIVSTNASIESIPTNVEAAEFHVVTKKKKTKKRQIIEEAKAKQQMSQRDQTQLHGRQSNNNTSNSSQKYQPSSTYTNDRDIYVNSLMTKENRRKSTSSVPPSDKSDSSDLDSVHSLPIESTTGCTSSIISYAEMARKANQQPDKLSNVNAWPSVSQNGKNSESPENSNTSTSSSIVSSKSQASNRSHDTIKASSSNEEKSPSNSDDSRTMDTPKLGEYVKNQLQKSKSCDNEKYTTNMSMDQFPGLEKTVKPQKSQPNFASVLTSPPPSLSVPPLSLPSQPSTSTAATVVVASPPPLPPITPVTMVCISTMTTNEKVAKPPITKKSSQSTAETNAPKEHTNKLQKPIEEKTDNTNKHVVDAFSSKLQFVQNSAKAEEIANSDSSNLFAPINIKKAKKTHQQPVNTQPQRTSRQNAVVFSQHQMSNEIMSPLLFGDFNDDILQLMKQEVENHVVDGAANGPTSIIDTSATNCLTAFESADNYATNDCNQPKPNIHTPMMSSQSDPGYASANKPRTIVPTESHEMINNHQVFGENHVGNSTITELSNRKSNVTKKTSLNKINVNNKISDVVSNQSLNNNNNMINNNISLGDTTTAKAVGVTQSICDSDSLNNNINLQMNDKNRHSVDVDVIKAQHNDVAANTKSLNAQNNVHNTVSKTTNNQPTANYQQKGIITYDNVNNQMIDTIANGPKVVSSSNKLSSMENEIVPVNSHPANVSHKGANHVEARGAFVPHNHNHNDIVHFVGSAWEEVKCGRAHYFGGQ